MTPQQRRESAARHAYWAWEGRFREALEVMLKTRPHLPPKRLVAQACELAALIQKEHDKRRPKELDDR